MEKITLPKPPSQPRYQRRCCPEFGVVLLYLPLGVREAIRLAVLYGNRN